MADTCPEDLDSVKKWLEKKRGSSFIGWIECYRVKPREYPTQDASSSTGERTRALCLTETPRVCLGGVLE
eukprot:COSAG04_NODE_6728_length_1268_cov_1.130881_2_plen_70_part_00